jgi:two-component system phosphate regulon sensor histidine kinase PhoR
MREDIFTIIAAIPLPTVIIGVDERLVNANEAAEEIFGVVMKGRHYATYFRNPQLLDAIEGCLFTKSETTAEIVINLRGAERQMKVFLRPFNAHDQSAVMLCFEDHTSLHEVGLFRRDFVANVSHELRTPLTSMLGFIETLRGPARDDQDASDRFLTILESETKRMVRLVRDLLALSEVEREERLKPTDETDIVSVLNATIERIKPLAESANVEVTLTSPEPAIPLRGNQDQLEQVFTNLIENAIKYGGTANKVEIVVKTIAHDTRLGFPAVEISVRDHGPGIPKSHIPRLTERFYRVDSHRSREMGGTGLGLAIVKHVLGRHRGRLEIESTLGQGTCFTVFLPLSQNQ